MTKKKVETQLDPSRYAEEVKAFKYKGQLYETFEEVMALVYRERVLQLINDCTAMGEFDAEEFIDKLKNSEANRNLLINFIQSLAK